MTTEASIGYGTLFKIGDAGSPEVFTAVAEVTSITPPGMSRDAIDATHMESPDKFREFIAGLIDGGEVSFDLNFVPGGASTTLLLAELEAPPGNKQVVFATGEIFSFVGFCTGFEPEAPVDDKMTATATYKVTGKPTLAGD